jgi:hypothetical protein
VTLVQWIVALFVLVLALSAVLTRLLAREASAGYPPSGQWLDIDGTRLHYTDKGSGRPVIPPRNSGRSRGGTHRSLFRSRCSRAATMPSRAPGKPSGSIVVLRIRRSSSSRMEGTRCTRPIRMP